MLHFSKAQTNIWQEGSVSTLHLFFSLPCISFCLATSVFLCPNYRPYSFKTAICLTFPLYLFKFYFHFSVIIHSLVSAWGPFFFAPQSPQFSGHWPTCFDECYYHSQTPTACVTSLCGNYPLLTSEPRGRVYLQPNDQQNTH